jgi:hypothetical protein
MLLKRKEEKANLLLQSHEKAGTEISKRPTRAAEAVTRATLP